MNAVLKLWFAATALFLVGAMIWAFVPVLVPLLVLTLGIGALCGIMVALARWIERRWRADQSR